MDSGQIKKTIGQHVRMAKFLAKSQPPNSVAFRNEACFAFSIAVGRKSPPGNNIYMRITLSIISPVKYESSGITAKIDRVGHPP